MTLGIWVKLCDFFFHIVYFLYFYFRCGGLIPSHPFCYQSDFFNFFRECDIFRNLGLFIFGNDKETQYYNNILSFRGEIGFLSI